MTGNINQFLWDSCDKGDAVGVLRGIAGGGEVDFINVESKGSQACLHTCMKSGSIECLELLCLNGANLDIEDNEGLNILDYAMETGNSEIISFTVAKLEGMI